MQMLISLFTTGGKINPIAMLLFVGVSIYLYNDFQGYREQARASPTMRESTEQPHKTRSLN